MFTATDGAMPFRADASSVEAQHSDEIVSFTLSWNLPLQWPVFARATDTLLALRGSDILRVKGLLAIEGCKGPVVVQIVQHLAHPPVELLAWPDADRESRLVFIARNIAECDVRALFEAVQALNRTRM
jgi:G3E family GTPase